MSLYGSQLADKTAYSVKVKNWARGTTVEAKSEITNVGAYDTGAGKGSVKERVYEYGGVPERIGFTFLRYMVFVEKGVGGVYKVMPKGSGRVVRITPGPINRHPEHWFNPVITRRIDTLANIASDQVANSAMDLSNILIQ